MNDIIEWMERSKGLFKYFNYILMIQIIPLLIMSSLLVYEISEALFRKQMIYYTIGLIIFIISCFIPWRKILWWFVPIFYIGNLILLIAVEFIGKKILGAQRWIEIPFTSFTIQPSEFIKVSVLLMLAYFISKNPPSIRGYDIKNFIKLSVIILVPFLLIAKEPDLGTALVLLITGYGTLFIVGINWKIWVFIFISLGLSGPLLYSHLHDYQKKRITDFMGKPSYHVQQALIAIGSGGMYGNKKEDATQTQLKFLPISSSDFIFAYLGERWGFLGMISVIFLYIFLIIHLLSITRNNSTDYLIITLSSGLAFLFFVYMGVNIYMIIGLAPVVGLPLPIFSHGGTSFIIFSIIFGILQNLLAFKRDLLYNTDSKVIMSSKQKSLKQKRSTPQQAGL
ncbi:Rod shape-determining protein RodA [hydrothermal vent metagenome]|uniref:Rod shape-determining protein RodA n=1 Tax=hydrothermal vent metagenome TaxID=652676 RepID=A0A1W1BRX8_9ZZZZ